MAYFAFGNALLSRLPVTFHAEHDLTWKTCEERCMQRVDIDVHGHTLHVYNVHLGTAILERRHQARRLAMIVSDRHVPGAKLVLGDFNEWTRGLATRLLCSHLRDARTPTYPGVLPFLRLDHIYYDPALELEKLTLTRTRKALVASDHLPLVGDFVWE